MGAFPTRRSPPVAAVVALLALLGAASCGSGSGGSSEPGATVPVETTTTSAAPADPFAVPSDPSKIDKEYVDRVLAALNKVYGDMTRSRVELGGFGPEHLVPLRAIFNDPEFELQAQAVAKSPIPPREALKEPLGDRRFEVRRILSAGSECVAVETLWHLDDVLTQPPAPKTVYVNLRPSQLDTDPRNLNPTPWSIAEENHRNEEDFCAR